MNNNDKLFIICLIGAALSFILWAYQSYKSAYERGLREGWHRGRAVNRDEFWSE